MYDLEEWYARDHEKYVNEETQFYTEHAKILKRLKTFDMSLVDNTDFITWAVTTPNPNFGEESLSKIIADPRIPDEVMRYSQYIDGVESLSLLDEWTASYFYKSAGAHKLESV